MLLASKPRRMGSLYILLFTLTLTRPWRMRGVCEVRCRVRDRVFFRFEKIAGSQRIIKIRLSTVLGVKPGGKGHRLDIIVPFHDLIMLLCPVVVPGHCCGLFI
jgi:hypothetical protein